MNHSSLPPDEDLRNLRGALDVFVSPRSEPLIHTALGRIGARTPRQWNDLYLARRLRLASGAAAVLLAALTLWSSAKPVRPGAGFEIASPSPLVTLEEDGFATYSSEPALLIDVLVGEEP